MGHRSAQAHTAQLGLNLPAKKPVLCFSHPQEAQGTDLAQGTGVEGSSCKWCDTLTGPTAAWQGFGTCYVAEKYITSSPIASHTHLCSLSSSRFTPLLQASERWQLHPFLPTTSDASKARNVGLWTGWVEALGAL